MKKQSGFTLIELAIVLVIIGLLLGGVLKGQELINSAKSKNLINEFKNVQILVYGYQDKYRSIPGDDALVTQHVVGSHKAGGTLTGNSKIDGNWYSTTATDESFLFWEHVRLAGLAPGSTDITTLDTYVPKNADGGQIGIQSLNDAFRSATGTINDDGTGTNTKFTGVYVVCSRNIVGKLAKQIDVTLDDGITNTGSVRVIADSAGTGAAPTATPSLANAAVEDNDPHTVCMAF